MHKSLSVVVALCALVFALTSVDTAEARKKKVRVTPYKAQTTFSFHNEEGREVYGLTVRLNRKAVAHTDPQTGFAGPFRNIRGNGTSRLRLANPAAPIAAGQAAGGEVTVTFRSEKKKLRVTTWWWTDQRGKPVGVKKSGKNLG